MAYLALPCYFVVIPFLPLGIFQQRLDGLPFVGRRPLHCVCGISADRKQNRVSASAGMHLAKD